MYPCVGCRSKGRIEYGMAHLASKELGQSLRIHSNKGHQEDFRIAKEICAHGRGPKEARNEALDLIALAELTDKTYLPYNTLSTGMRAP